MNTLRLVQTALAAAIIALPLAASAQSYDPVTGGVCGLINFQFCPQPPVPVADLPDPEGDAERAVHPVAPHPAEVADEAPMVHHHHSKHHHIHHHAE